MKHIVIGDVHGCLSELRCLLKKIGVDADDKIIFIGDLIMKGPHQVEVLEYVKDLAEFNDVTLVRGNHEKRLLKYLGLIKTNPYKASEMKKSFSLERLRSSLTNDAIEFLKSSVWFCRFSSGNREFMAIHGGITPKMSEKNFSTENPSAKNLRKLDQLCHIKYVTPEGNMKPFCTHAEGEIFWAEVYDGRFGYAIYGHQAYMSVTEYTHAIGVDLGCVYGNQLAALIIEDGRQYITTVKAEDVYFSEGPGPI